MARDIPRTFYWLRRIKIANNWLKINRIGQNEIVQLGLHRLHIKEILVKCALRMSELSVYSSTPEIEELTPEEEEQREKNRKIVHLKSEHKRRAQIQSGFDRVRMELPLEIYNKKLSKNDLLSETIQYLRHLENLAEPFLNNEQ